jgi:acetylornithine deacetylase/succinyl-diaminopimelate desuccinylase-like protein
MPLATLLLMAAAHAQSLLAPDQAERFARASFPEFLELLALPSDAANPADIQRNAAWLETAFRKRGFTTRPLAKDGKPLVYAELPAVAGRKTVLFYMHFDAQPVYRNEWKVDPWQPCQGAHCGRRGAPIPTERLQRPALDPRMAFFARASADDKGPIVMFLAAVDAFAARAEPVGQHRCC